MLCVCCAQVHFCYLLAITITYSAFVVALTHLRVMEVLMRNARKHLNLTGQDGFTLLHDAVHFGHTTICSLLAAEVLCSFLPGGIFKQ